VPHVVGRRADGNGAGDIGGAVLVLAAGIDQEKLTRRDAAIAGNAQTLSSTITSTSSVGRNSVAA